MPLNLPEPDPARLPGSPLELVVCQVRFDTRLRASDGQAALDVQAALGGPEGPYPGLEEVTSVNTNVVVGSGVTETTQKGWRLTSSDGKWVVSLMPDHLALETTEYTTWEEDFQPRLAAVIDAVVEHVSPAVEQRIGLRFVDRITEMELSDLRDWEPYLRREVLGLIVHPELGSSVRQAQHQVLIELEDDAVCGFRNGPIRDEVRGLVDYVLDYDVYRQGGRPFDGPQIKDTADRFNTFALQIFQTTITERLLERFRQR